MNRFEKLLEDYKKNKTAPELSSFKAASAEQKARIILEDESNASKLGIVVVLLIIVIVGNIFLDPPMFFHSAGHFEVIFHPFRTLKQLYFGWGDDGNCFILSWMGLKHYFTSIPDNYRQFGALVATFSYLTQFSPIWGFSPLHLFLRGLFSFLDVGYLAQVEDFAKFIKEKETKLDESV